LQRNSDNLQPQQLLTEVFNELHSLEELARSKAAPANEELCLLQAAVEAERQRYQDLFEFAPTAT